MRKTKLLLTAMLSIFAWSGAMAQEKAEYEAALDAIEDGAVYSVKTSVDGSYYYLKADGTLTAAEDEAGKYTFQKVKGTQYEYGFKLNSNGSFFSNPPGTDKSNLLSGKLNTSDRGDNNWEAQVFFLKDAKYAVRSTNAGYADSGWSWVGSAFWTVAIAEAVPVAQYDFAPQYIWELEKDNFASQQAEAYEMVKSWPYYIQTVTGLVTEPAKYSSNAVEPLEGSIANLLDNNYESFFHSCWSSGPDEDHYLQAEFPEATQTFQFYFKKRSQNNNNRPTKIALSASNDGKTFEDITVLDEGFPTEALNLDYISDVIDLGSAYKYVRFTVTETNTPDKKCNNHIFFTFSEFYMYPIVDAATEAFKVFKTYYGVNDIKNKADIESIKATDAALKEALKTVKVTYVVKNGLGDVVFKSNPVTVKAGETITSLPAEYKRGFTKYSDVNVTVNDDATIEFTETWDGPFQVSTSLENAKYYNMTIRSDFSVFVEENEPYYPKTAPAYKKASDEYQWAFAGDAYTFVVFNKSKGINYTLTKEGSNVVMREGIYAWELNPNADGFTLKEIGTDYNCVNQNGGPTGPLQFWNSINSPRDNGSTFRISEVPTEFDWTIGETGYATMYVPVPTYVDVPAPAVGVWSFDDPENLLAGKGVATLSPTKEYPILADKKTIADATDLADAGITAVAGIGEGDGAIFIPKGASLKMTHNLGVDALPSYTFMMDIKLADVNKYTSLYQSNINNTNDGELFVHAGQIGVNYNGVGYGGTVVADTWHRVVFVAEDALPTIYLDGVQVAKANKADGRWSMDPSTLFFADEDGEETDVVTSKICFWDYAMTAAQVAKLATAGTKVPEPTGVEAFTATITDGYVKLQKIEGIVPANAPVILKGAPGTYCFAIPSEVLGLPHLENDLQGAAEDIQAVGKYVLAKPEGKEVGFYLADKGVIKAGKAYLELPMADVKELLFTAPEDPTAIQSVDANTVNNAVIYNVAGQRLSKMQKGINIVNGKKYLK